MSKSEQRAPSPLLESFSSIFYVCKVLGVYPHDFQKFKQDKVLQKSSLGSGVVIAVMIVVFVFYNLMILTFQQPEFQAQMNKLTMAVILLFTYIGPGMMITDQVSAIRNQEALASLFERINRIDEGLRQQGVVLNNRPVALQMRLLIATATSYEVLSFGLSYWLLLDRTEWTSWLWMFSNVPTLYNSFDKIWFFGLLLSLKERFRVINVALEAIAEEHAQHLSERARMLGVQNATMGDVLLEDTLQIFGPVARKGSDENVPSDIFGEYVHNSKLTPKKPKPAELHVLYESELSDVAVIEAKFVQLCQLHDGLCTSAKILNELWYYQLLILMAYGFVIFTAQLYFFYCAAEAQPIPGIFRLAKDAVITVFYLSYISGKCVLVMFLSWKTSLESKRTGVCLHKCGVAADTNEIYEIVNHLSLKLLNHAVNFSACGFFTLDMETLFAVCGAITSYLIILIQFNMAGQQLKTAQILSIQNDTDLMVFGNENTTAAFGNVLFLN